MPEFSERRTYESVVIQMARLEERILAANEALKLARLEIDRRLETMNELRNQITSERGIFMTRLEYETKHDAMGVKIADIQKFVYMISGGLLVVQLLIGVLMHFWKGP